MVKLKDIGYKALKLEEPLLRFGNGNSIYQDDLFKKTPYMGANAVIGVYLVEDMQGVSEVKKCAYEVFVKNYFEGNGAEFPFSPWKNITFTMNRRFRSKISFSFNKVSSPADFPTTTVEEMAKKIKNEPVDLLIFICSSKYINDIHDEFKILAHFNNKRVQFISSETIVSKLNSNFNSEKREFIQGLAIQILAKCGGIPWKLDKDDVRYKLKPGSLVIGLGYKKPEKDLIVRGAAHFFDQENSVEKFVSKSFEIAEQDMKSLYFPTEVLKQIIQEATEWYKSQSNRKTKALYILKNSRLNPREMEAFRMSGLNWTHIFLKFGGTKLRLYDTSNKISGKEFMVERGIALVSNPSIEKINDQELNRVDAVITTTGVYTKRYANGSDYSLGTLGTPRPLEIEIHSNFDDNAEDVVKLILALTKIDWENMDLEYREPTVIKYAGRMADLSYCAANMKPPVSLENINFDVRDLM